MPRTPGSSWSRLPRMRGAAAAAAGGSGSKSDDSSTASENQRFGVDLGQDVYGRCQQRWLVRNKYDNNHDYHANTGRGEHTGLFLFYCIRWHSCWRHLPTSKPKPSYLGVPTLLFTVPASSYNSIGLPTSCFAGGTAGQQKQDGPGADYSVALQSAT